MQKNLCSGTRKNKNQSGITMHTLVTNKTNTHIHGGLAKTLPSALPSDIELLLYQYQEIHSHNGKITTKSTFIDRLVYKIQKQLIHGSNAERIDFFYRCIASIVSRTHSLLQRITPHPTEKQEPNKIAAAILIGGSVGDFIQQLPFLQQLSKTNPTLTFHLYCKKEKLGDQANLCFGNLGFITKILSQDDLSPKSYDLLINLRHVVKYETLNEKKIEHLAPSLTHLIKIANERFKPFEFIYESHPYMDGLFGRLMAKMGLNAAEASCYFGGFSSCEVAPSLCPDMAYIYATKKFGLFEHKYITVHDGFDINNKTLTNRVTKQWPKEYWEDLIANIKINFPQTTIVQIGAPKTSSPIDNVDLNLIGKTNLHEVAWLIKNALLHIDGESGLTRIAWAFNTPEICIQGPSASKFFSFGSTINLHPSGCKDCWWIKEDWFSSCIRGQHVPECMASIKPSQVYTLAASILNTPH